MTFKAPLLSQNLIHQIAVCTAGLAIGSVVRPHYSFNLSFFDAGLKLRKIRLPEFLHTDLCIKKMSFFLRSRMYGKMLGTCCRAQIFSVPLQTFDKCDAQSGNQGRIFPIGLMPAPPAGIAKDINVWGPKCDSFIYISVFMFFVFIIFGSCLCRNRNSDLKKQRFIKSRSQSDSLRKYGSHTGPGNTMQAFIPPVILRNIQPGNLVCIKTQLRCQFFYTHLFNQFSCLFDCLLSVHIILQKKVFYYECSNHPI